MELSRSGCRGREDSRGDLVSVEAFARLLYMFLGFWGIEPRGNTANYCTVLYVPLHPYYCGAAKTPPFRGEERGEVRG
jgi:hypothetical protein